MPFSATACIRFGWGTFKKRPLTLALAFAVTAVISWVLDELLTRGGDQGGTFLVAVAFLIKLVVSMLVGMGITAFFLKAHDAVQSVRIADLWHPQPFWKYTGASLLYFLAVVVGLILLIIPGIIAMIVLWFTQYLVIDRNLDPIAALKESARLTKGHRLELFLLWVLVLALNLIGILLVGVGLLVSVPVTTLAIVHAYRTLSRPAQVV